MFSLSVCSNVKSFYMKISWPKRLDKIAYDYAISELLLDV